MPAQCSDLISLRFNPWRNGQQQVTRICGAQRVEVFRGQSGNGEVLARSNQQQATNRWNQRLDLRGVSGVIHQQQCAPAVEHGEIKTTQLAFTLREFGGWMVSANDVGQGLSNGEWLGARTFEIEKELE